MYISVSDTAKKFSISKRRVQILCEQGRIEGAAMADGVWLIPEDAKKPADARKKTKNITVSFLEREKFNSIDAEYLTIEQVCDLFSISMATAKNWMRLGKLKSEEDGKFSREYIEDLLAEIRTGKDNRLKSRRNKKNLRGMVMYKDYVSNKKNIEIVENILNVSEQFSESELRIILAHFAVQLYSQSGGSVISEADWLKKQLPVTEHRVFQTLISDLAGNLEMEQGEAAHIEEMLGYEVTFVPSEDTLGFIYISLRELNKRKQMGAYYTPQKTVQMLVEHLMECTDFEKKTVCDPCCGTGNFLIGLLDRGINAQNLYGQDIDEISILITRINMFLLDHSLSEGQLYTQFICGNTLKNTFSRTFSVILGNPPWGYDYSKEETEVLVGKYATAKRKGMESYDLFIEKGLAMAEKNGYVAYVLPEAILNVASHQKARELLLKNTAFQFVHYLGNAFSGIQCPAIIFGVQNGGMGQTKKCKVVCANQSFIIKENREIDAGQFSFAMTDDEYACLHAISSIPSAKYLAGNAKFALGIVTGNNKEYIKEKKEDGYESILRGSEIYRYRVKNTENYIRFVPEHFQQVAPVNMYRADEKLLYRFISEVPVFAYDNQKSLSLNSCNILIPQIKDMDMKYVLAILNSSVAAYFMNKKYNSVKVLRSHIEALPIPVADEDAQKEIIKKVDYMINAENDISGLYEELDQAIMDLYHLTAKHREVIKVALKGKNLFFPLLQNNL